MIFYPFLIFYGFAISTIGWLIGKWLSEWHTKITIKRLSND